MRSYISTAPTGDLFQPNGDLAYEDGVAAFAEQIRGLKDGGIDVVWIETMFDEQELRAAMEAAAAHGLPAVYTMSFDTSGRTMMGWSTTHAEFLQSCAYGGRAAGRISRAHLPAPTGSAGAARSCRE